MQYDICRGFILFIGFLFQIFDAVAFNSTDCTYLTSIFEIGTSFVRIKWSFVETIYIEELVDSHSLRYSSAPVYGLATLEMDPITKGFQAKNTGEITFDIGGTGGGAIRTEVHKTHMLIAVAGLKYANFSYDFTLSRALFGKNYNGTNGTIRIEESALVTARTGPVLPKPPKLGAGCFHIYDHADWMSARAVKIYWQDVPDALEYNILVFQESSLRPLFNYSVPQGYGWTKRRMNYKRHWFVVRSKNEVGYSAEYSVVQIPPQEEILPPLAWQIRWNETEKSIALTWQRPSNYQVDNFTILWVDTLDGKASERIYDFVILPKFLYEFKVKNISYPYLGLSVNSNSSSSGMWIPCLN